MNSTNVSLWQIELQTAFVAADQAKSVLMKHYGKLQHVVEKAHEGLVTEADQESEEVIRAAILKQFPQHGILGEEGGMQGSKAMGPLWMIDPVDGTTNYVYQLPFFCISIALQVNGQSVVGVVDAPLLNWRFHAVRGQGAFRNGERISASRRGTIEEGLFATGFAYHYGPNELDRDFRVLKQIVTRARGVRRAGSAALDLCMVACGVFDGYWESSLKPWDSAAGSLIAEEAGACVTNYKGDTFDVHMPDVLASNTLVHGELVRLIQSAP